MIGLCIPDIGWLVCRFAVCRIFPALKSQAGKPRANEHPSFHQHFRQLAGMSPLRYQKWLRLNEARRLMLNEHYDVTTAAYVVGYESLSHFSREYSRMFGESPKRDITRLKSLSVSFNKPCTYLFRAILC